MLHDRVLVAPAPGEGERRSRGGIVIPATAQVSKRLVWGEVGGRGYVVLRERDLHAVASPSDTSPGTESQRRTSTGTGLYL